MPTLDRERAAEAVGRPSRHSFYASLKQHEPIQLTSLDFVLSVSVQADSDAIKKLLNADAKENVIACLLPNGESLRLPMTDGTRQALWAVDGKHNIHDLVRASTGSISRVPHDLGNWLAILRGTGMIFARHESIEAYSRFDDLQRSMLERTRRFQTEPPEFQR